MEELDKALGVIEDLFNKSHSLVGVAAIFPQTQAIIMHPFYTSESAPEFEEFLKRYCIENKIDRFFIATEAWASKRSQDDTSPYTPPSLDPEREEILVVTCITKNGDTVAMAPIIGSEAPARFLGNWKKHTEGIALSRWDTCLKHN